MITEQQLDAAFDELSEATRELYGERSSVVLLKQELSRAETRRIAAGIEGKNEMERTAKLRQLTNDERENLAAAEYRLTVSERNYELARCEVDRVKWWIRYASVVWEVPENGANGEG